MQGTPPFKEGSMRTISPFLRLVLFVTLTQCAVGLSFNHVAAQSQEPKPGREIATPTADATPVYGETNSGLGAGDWQSPTWGISVAWNPEIWTVENEVIEGPYEGLQLGSAASTVYIEAFEGFEGSALECLTAAEQEITARANTREVKRLSGRSLPEAESAEIEAALFGVVADLPDGTIYRGAEYVSCRSVQPGLSVLEMTWQTATVSFNEELPKVRDLFASLTFSRSENS